MLPAARLLPGCCVNAGLQILFFLLIIVTVHDAYAQSAVTYDIVYVRAPRYGDVTLTKWPEVINPVQAEPGSDLMLLLPNGSEEVLFAAGNGAVVDPVPSFDAKWIYFSYFPDVRTAQLNYQRNNAPILGRGHLQDQHRHAPGDPPHATKMGAAERRGELVDQSLDGQRPG